MTQVHGTFKGDDFILTMDIDHLASLAQIIENEMERRKDNITPELRNLYLVLSVAAGNISD